jgi:hypothetical protein
MKYGSPINLLSVVIAIGWLGLSPAFAADGWKYQVVPNDGHELTYSEADKVTFYLGCGRGFALQLKYPGIAKKEGKARVTIANAKSKMTFDGEFVEPIEVEVPVPMKFATEFSQTYLGYAKQDPQVYGKKWLALRARLYALLGSGEPLKILAGKDSYQLPPIDAANWRKPFEGCGLGADW